MAHDVFISYASSDKPVADAVCAALENRGVRCWIAPRDILPGLDWGAAIIGAITDCRVMVLVFSSHVNRSRQIKREVERAVSKGVTVVPLRIEDVPPGKTLEYFISTPHWLDALTPPLDRHLDHLAETVALLLTRGTRDSTDIPVAPPRRSGPPAPAPAAAIAAGQKAGRFSFSLSSPIPQRVTLEATLSDSAGRRSDPFRFTFDVRKPAAGRRNRSFTTRRTSASGFPDLTPAEQGETREVQTGAP